MRTMPLAAAVAALLTAHFAAAQDDHGDDIATASLLPLGSTRPGTMDGGADLDMFRVDLPGSATVQFRTTGQTDTEGELLDSEGGRIMSDDDSGPGENFDIEADLEPGVYYVSVEGESGDYAVSARLGGNRDHGDTVGSSTLLPLHTPEELASVSTQVLLATAGRIWPSPDDVDVFRIDVDQDSTDVVVRTSGGTDTYATLVDGEGTELAADSSDGNFRIERTLDAGVYYAHVRGLEVGAYRILGTIASVGARPEPSPGATAPPAPEMGAPGPRTITVAWEWTFAPLERTSFNVEVREKGDSWEGLCAGVRNQTNDEITDTLTLTVDAGVKPSTTYEARYRHRNVGSCSDSVDPDQKWSAVGSVTTPADDDEGGSGDGYCRDGDDVQPGGECDIYDRSGAVFSVSDSGTGCFTAGGFTSCAGQSQRLRNTTINGRTYTLVADRNADDSWTIDDVEPEPPNDAAHRFSAEIANVEG